MPLRSIALTPLFKTTLPNDKELTVSIIQAGAGSSPIHSHPGHSFTYILEGEQQHETPGVQRTLRAGEVILDPPGQVHRTGNAAPVKLLVVRILDKGAPEMVVVDSF